VKYSYVLKIMKLIGERIRRKRENMHMQLNELAKKVGISPSALSQIEKAKASPSIVTLKAIADRLHTSVGELIGENEVLTKYPLVKFEEKRYVEENESGTSLYLLSNHGNNKQMDTFLINFKENADSNNIMKKHPGQEFCFILKGELEVQLDERIFILRERDSFYFNSNRMHSARNRAKGETEVLWVITPPEE